MINGVDREDGAHRDDGVDGADGADGVDGADGEDGGEQVGTDSFDNPGRLAQQRLLGRE